MKNKSLAELIKQDPKMLAKNCSKHFDKVPQTLENELIEIFEDSKVRKHLKDKGVSVANVGLNGFGEVKIEIYLSNDKIAEKKLKEAREHIDSFLESLIKKMKESK